MSTEAADRSPPLPETDASLCRNCGETLQPSVNFCPVCGQGRHSELLPDPLVGQVVAERYKIQKLLGRGGMGVVYKCEHVRMGKVMAIKLLHGELARDTEVQRRFRREAQAISRLSDPSTVSVFDFGTTEGLMYLVMEFLAGEDLGKILRAVGPIPPVRAAAIAIQACNSLAEAHDNAIVHRDLKPENLLITRHKDGRETVKLLDFGLAKLIEGEERNELSSGSVLVGTPYYIAPEVIRGQPADHRVDLYALGAVLYRAVTGCTPFSGNSPVAVLTKALTDELIPPTTRRPELQIPEAFERIVLKCLAREPQERFQRALDVRQELLEFLLGQGVEDPTLVRDSVISGASLKLPALRAGPVTQGSAGSTRAEVATRGDVEAFERSLRRSRLATRGLFLAALGGLVAAGALWLQHTKNSARMSARDRELEPNNVPHEATLIAPDTEVRGVLGEKLNSSTGDVDFYRLTKLPPGTWRLHVECTGVPYIDLAMELLTDGETRSHLVADEAREAGGELIPGFRLSGGQSYLLSLHEAVRAGIAPRETISYEYRLKYSLARLDPRIETEPNNREEIAWTLPSSGTLQGWLESADDDDWYCLESPASQGLRLSIRPPPDLDVALVLHPRNGSADSTHDEHTRGAVEALELPVTTGSRGPCVEVRASTRTATTWNGNPETAYTLELQARP